MPKLQTNDMRQFVELVGKGDLLAAGALLENTLHVKLSTAEGRQQAADALTYSGPLTASPRLTVARVYFAMRDHGDGQS